MGDQRNVVLAIALSVAVMLLYQFLVLGPAQERQRLEEEARQVEAVETPGEGDLLLPQSEDAGADVITSDHVSFEEALSRSDRIVVDTPSLRGSIALTGARFDDLELSAYRQELADDSPPVPLFRPSGSEEAYYAFHGWIGGDDRTDMPGQDTPWTVIEGDVLTPESPVTIGYETGDGLLFRRTIEVDADYMFTVTERVTNSGVSDVSLQPYTFLVRDGIPSDLAGFYILHEGAVGVLGRLIQRSYKKLSRSGEDVVREAESGWLGFTTKYWLAAIIPPQGAHVRGTFHVSNRGERPLFQARYLLDEVDLAAGESIELTSHVFAGAKEAAVLRRYESELGIDRFNLAIDWGNFWFLTKPLFWLLAFFESWIGNFGVAILMLTIVVKILFFPIANASYKAMARMKGLQPKIKEMRERFKDDQKRQQQEMVELYKREKVNPVAGCVPIIPQMIVFYALYKTLFVTIEMRHEPFFGWIRDLSAADPTNMWNLFGLLPYDPSGLWLIGGFLGIGAWPLLYGGTMAALQTLNPPPPDPTQARIFAAMPLVFMFILAPFAAGLLIYWTWNNVLSFAQQYLIMRRQGVDTPIGLFLSNNYRRLRERLSSGASP